jgi:integrating conjugative element protein (TIGR03757 family)
MVNHNIHLSKDLFVCLIVYLTLPISFNAVAEETNKANAEVFISASVLHVPGAENTVIYMIDRIDQLQQELSKDLPSDPVKAKQDALQRFQVMDSRLSHQLENTAKGLVKAMHYGIDRYPAIVFEGKAVVYGVTDLGAANRIYQKWQAEGKR